MQYKAVGMTMAVTNMDAMVAFYSAVFGVEFGVLDMFNTKLYTGKWDGRDLLFCPAKVAGITATQNRHQFDIGVISVKEALERCLEHGGEKMHDVMEDGGLWSVGVRDPDGNSMVFKSQNP